MTSIQATRGGWMGGRLVERKEIGDRERERERERERRERGERERERERSS